MKKRILSIILLLCMVFSLCDGIVPAYAETAENQEESGNEEKIIASYDLTTDDIIWEDVLPTVGDDEDDLNEDGGLMSDDDAGEVPEDDETIADEDDSEDENVAAEFTKWRDYLSNAVAEGRISIKEDYAALRAEYEDYLTEVGYETEATGVLNGVIGASVSVSGQYVVNGLLYDFGGPWSSETLVTVDGDSFFFEADEVYTEGNSAVAVMYVDTYGICVNQILSFEEGHNVGQQDLVKISYSVDNWSDTSRTVSVRMLMDTAASGNDAAKYTTESGEYCSPATFIGDSLPEYYNVCDAENNVCSTGIVKLGTGNDATGISFVEWSSFFNNANPACESDGEFCDSAVVLDFAPVTVTDGCSAYAAATALGYNQNLENANDSYGADPMTFFEWISENGIDVEGLTKEEFAELSDEYSAYRRDFLAENGEMPEGAVSGSFSNAYLEVAVASNGRFTIGNREGNPNYSTDNNQRLLYGHPSPSTSETLIVIQDDNGSTLCENFFSADTISYTSNSAVATMKFNDYGITVTQTLKLVKSGSTGFEDNVQIQYSVANNGSRNYRVGIRIMLDTMLANNDCAPFKVAGVAEITKIKTFTGLNIPISYQVYDDLNNPTTLATGFLKRGGNRNPDKVSFCNWPGIHGSSWSYTPTDGYSLGDSAVAVYFNPTTVTRGKSTTVSTFYGVYVGTAMGGGTTTVTGSSAKISVKDIDTGDPVEGATATYNGNTYLANSYGVITVPCDNKDEEWETITFQKSGYTDLTKSVALKKGAVKEVEMKKPGSKVPAITSIKVLDLNGNEITGTAHFIENSNKDLEKTNAKGTITIKVETDTPGCTFLLMQDETRIGQPDQDEEKIVEPNSTGEFKIKACYAQGGIVVDKLKAGGSRYVRVISKTGEKKDYKLDNVKVSIPSFQTSNAFQDVLFDLKNIWTPGSGKVSGKGIAALFLGGDNKLKFGPKDSNFKIKVSVSDCNTVRVGINADPDLWNSAEKDAAKFKEMKEMVANRGKDKEGFKKYAAKNNNKLDMGAWSVPFEFFGFGEGTIENGVARVDVGIVMSLYFKGEHTSYYVVGIVPLYLNIGAQIGAEAELTCNLYGQNGLQFKVFNGKLTPSFELWIEGGVGAKDVLGVGAKGDAKVAYTMDFVDKSQRATLTGSASLELYLTRFYTKEYELVKTTVKLYDSNDKEGTVYDDDVNIYEELAAIPFRLVTRDELYGEPPEGGGGSSGTDTRYISVGDKLYRFRIADRGGDVINSGMLSFSQMENGTWSEELPVYNDGTTDAAYDIATDGSKIYVVWQNIDSVLSDNTGVDTFIACSEVCYAEIDTADGNRVGRVTDITDNSAADMIPAVTCVNGDAYIAWYYCDGDISRALEEDAQNEIVNHIRYTCVSEGTAGDVSDIVCETGLISEVSASNASGIPVATYAVYPYSLVDNGGITICSVNMSNGSASELTDGESVFGKIVPGEIDGTEMLFRYKDGNIVYGVSLDDESGTVFDSDALPETLSQKNYTVLKIGGSTYLVWTTSPSYEGEATDIMASCYSGGEWTAPYKLTSVESGTISSLYGYENSSGNIVLSYMIDGISHDKVLGDETEIEIIGIDYDNKKAEPGEILPLSIEFKNNGNTAVSSIDVSIADGGDIDYSKTVTGLELAPGQTTVIEITNFTVPSACTVRSGSEGQYTPEVELSVPQTEASATENIAFGYAHIYLEQDDFAYIDGRKNAAIVVHNDSGFEARQVHVRVIADATDGVLVCDEILDSIPAYDSATMYIDVEDNDSIKMFAYTTDYSTEDDTPISYSIINLSDEQPNYEQSGILTLTSGQGGSVSTASGMEVITGTTVTLKAVPDDEHLFSHWSSEREILFEDGSDEFEEETNIIYPYGDIEIQANFVKILPSDFELSDDTVDLTVGKTYKVSAVFAQESDRSKVTWRSDNEDVACVSQSGNITAVGAGQATITASSGRYSHSCTVTVGYEEIESVSVAYPQVTLNDIGETFDNLCVVTPVDASQGVFWVSDNPAVAEVDRTSGRITARSYGTATVKAVAWNSNDENPIEDECEVRVVKTVSDIELDQYSLILPIYETDELNISYLPEDCTDGKEITWTIDDDSIAELVPSGDFNEKLTIRGTKIGSTTIYAKTSNGIELSCSLQVRSAVVEIDDVTEFESDHNYTVPIDKEWIYRTDSGSNRMILHFCDETNLAEGDVITVCDAYDNVIVEAQGNELADENVKIYSSEVKIRLVSAPRGEGNDSTDSGYYGFKVDSVIDSAILTEDNCSIVCEPHPYEGRTVYPEYELYYGKTKLSQGEDYTAEYSNMTGIGTGTITVTGCNIFAGSSLTFDYDIVPGDIDLAAKVVDSGIKLDWTESCGAQGYYIYRSEINEEQEPVLLTATASRTYTDASAEQGAVYSYKVVPYASVLDREYLGKGGSIVITRFGPLKNLKGEPQRETVPTEEGWNRIQYSVSLTWDPLSSGEGEVNYCVYRRTEGYYYYSYYNDDWEQIGTVRGAGNNSFVDDTVQYYGNLKYSYIVVPELVFNDGTRCFGGESEAVTLRVLEGPYYISAYSYDKKGATVSTNFDTNNNDGVEIWKSVNGGDYKLLKTLKSNAKSFSFTDSSAKAVATLYNYKARTFVKDGTVTYYSPFIECDTPCFYITEVSIKSMEGDRNGINIVWNNLKGVDGFDVYRQDITESRIIYSDVDSFVKVGTAAYPGDKAKTVKFTDTDAQTGRQYIYCVSGFKVVDGVQYPQQNIIRLSSPLQIVQIPSKPSINVYNSTKGITVSGYTNSGYTTMDIYRSENGGPFKLLKTVKTNTYLDTSAKTTSSVYAYKVRMNYCNGKLVFHSEESDVRSVGRLPASSISNLKIVSAGDGTGLATMSIAPVKDADRYILTRIVTDYTGDTVISSTDDIKFWDADNQKSYPAQDTVELKPGTSITYSVTAEKDTEDGVINSRANASFTYYDKPEIALESGAKGIKVSVTEAESAVSRPAPAKYDIYRAEGNGAYKKLKTVTPTWTQYGRVCEYVDTSATKKDVYYRYKAMANIEKAGMSMSEFSDEAKCLRLPAIKITGIANAAVGYEYPEDYRHENLYQSTIHLDWNAIPGADRYIIAAHKADSYTYDYDTGRSIRQPGYTEYFETDGANTSFDAEELMMNSMYSFEVTAVVIRDGAEYRATSDTKQCLAMSGVAVSSATENSKGMVRVYLSYSSGYLSGCELKFECGGKTKIVKAKNYYDINVKNPFAGKDGCTVSARLSAQYYSGKNKATYYSNWSEPFEIYSW